MLLTEPEIDALVTKSKLINKYNKTIDNESAYEILTAKLEQAAQKNQEMQQSKTQAKAKPEPGFFDSPIVKQAGRTAASIITRSLLGALGMGGRSKKSIW